MNELIERLAEQCYEHDQSWTGVGQRIFNKEKFAQLIVRESVKALWTEDCHVSDLAIIDFNEKKRKIFNHMGITE
jgi:hypothetical protein